MQNEWFSKVAPSGTKDKFNAAYSDLRSARGEMTKIGKEIAEESLGKFYNAAATKEKYYSSEKGKWVPLRVIGDEVAFSVLRDNLYMREYQNKKLLESAKKNDAYSLDYLELLPEELSGDKNTKARLKDYEKYLFSPTEWNRKRNS